MVYQKKANKGPSTSSSTFRQRALTTFTIGPVALGLIYLGGWYYFAGVAVVVLLATFEYSGLLGHLGWRLPLWILVPSVLLQLVAAAWPSLQMFAPALAGSLFVVMLYALWLYEKRSGSAASTNWAGLAAGIVLLGWMSGHFFHLRSLGASAAQWTILAMVSTWLADSAAYVFGTWLGRHKLAPRLSPGKTVEGYLAGIIVGTATTVGVGALLQLPLGLTLLIGFLISTISPAGDLGISLFKREAAVKDSGQIIPGHGGALDRIDSLLWSVTIAYYVLLYLN